jgi:predicted O-methyltransferase YrrM
MKIDEVEEKMKGIYALNTKEERAAFYEYASKVPDDGIIVDVGTCGGGSTFVFALASKPGVKVHTMDPTSNEKFFDNVKNFDMLDKIIYYEETSEEVAKTFDEKIDLLFLDGIHSYKGVSNDFNWYKDNIVKGGVVMFHDYYLYRNQIGRAVDEIEASGEIEKIEIVDSLYGKDVRTGLYIARKT